MSEAIRNSIIALAEEEMGTTENPRDSNIIKYNDWFYPDNHKYHTTQKNNTYVPSNWAWCGTFCSYVYHFAGWTMPHIDLDTGVSYIPTLYYKAKSLKWDTKEPKAGDLVLFDFKNDGKIFAQHIGIFDKWIEKGKTFTCIEGNTSSNEKGSQDNGGGVYKRTRNVSNVIQFVNLLDNVK